MKQSTAPLPANAARLRNLIHGANHLMSHILHFYHLVALDYVAPTVHLGGNAFATVDRPFLCPRYDPAHYITDQRILAMVGLGIIPPLAVGVLTTLPGVGPGPGYANIGNAVNTYLTGQYLKALDIRRIAHEMHAIFSGRAPICSGFTPGGITATVDQASINAYQAKLTQIKNFVGEPSDFLNGVPGTMMFDVVAAAHLFPEYFWIGNSYNQFIAWGVFEACGVVPLTGDFGGIFGAINNPDQRGLRRGYKLNALPGPSNSVDILKIGESIAGSRYNKLPGGQYPDGSGFKHPWSGQTQPRPYNEYSWLKSPRYNIGGVDPWQPFEVGPLARQVVNGTYWAGILTAVYPALGPVLFPGAPGPDIATGADLLGAALLPVYSSLPKSVPGPGGPNLRVGPGAVTYTGDSILDRIAARATETRIMIDIVQHNLNLLSGTIGVDGYGPHGCTDPAVPVSLAVKKGYGMTEASRGALSHWIKMKNGKTTLYQAIVPTTWNANPRDVNGKEGPAERSLQGAVGNGLWVADPAEPIEVIRTTHSYDFCIACAVHLITPEGEVKKVDIPALPG